MRTKIVPSPQPLLADPPNVVFREAAQRKSNRTAISLRNVSTTSTRVALEYAGCSDVVNVELDVPGGDARTTRIAPGMVFMIQIQLVQEVTANYEDCIRVKALDLGISLEVPITVFAPAPRVTLNSGSANASEGRKQLELKYGTCIADGRLYSRSFTLRNEGSVGTTFTVLPDSELQQLLDESNTHCPSVQIRPEAAHIGPAGTDTAVVEVHVEVSSSIDIASFSHAVEVMFENPLQGRLTVNMHAEFAQHKLRILDVRNDATNAIDLGCAYYNTKRTTSIVVVNDGPEPISFFVECIDVCTYTYQANGARDTDEPHALNEGGLVIRPHEGTLHPRQKRTIHFDFCPVFGAVVTGWTRGDGSSPRRDYSATVCARAVGTDLVATCALSGTGVSPAFSLSSKELLFPECRVGRTTTMDFTIKNHSDMLSLPLEVNPIAHFSATPAKCLLLCGQEQTVSVCFEPSQIGKLDTSLVLKLGKASTQMTVRLRAQCPEDLAATQRTRGFGLATTARKLLQPPSDRFYFGFTPTVDGKQGGYFSGPDGRQREGMHATVNPNARLRPVRPAPTAYQVADPTTARSMHETLCKQSNDKVYHDYIRQQQLKRTLRATKRRQHDIANLSDDGGIGAPPTLTLADITPVLPAKTPRGKPGSAAASHRPAKDKRGSATKQRRHSRSSLSPEEISKVELRNSHRISLGDVCEGSTATEQLEFSNSLEFDVTLTLRPGKFAELQLGTLGPLTIRPGATAVVELTLSNITQSTPRRFSDSLEYVLNGLHAATVVVQATVVAPRLTVTPQRVVVPVGCYARCPRASAVVTLTNPLRHPVAFTMAPIDPRAAERYDIVPARGTVPAGGAMCCAVEVLPSYDMPAAADWHVLVDGNATVPQRITCAVDTRGAKCRLLKERILFEEIGVRASSARECVVVNEGTTDAFYHVADVYMRPESPDNIRVVPAQGRVPAGGKAVLHVHYTPQKANKFDGGFVVKIRDRKQPLKVSFGGSARNSSIEIKKKKFAFGALAAGATASQPFDVVNPGKSDATVSFDLVEYPAFRVLQRTQGTPQPLATGTVPAPSDGGDQGAAAGVSVKGHVYTVDVAAGATCRLLLESFPREVAAYDFLLPIACNGMPWGERRCCATVLRPSLSVSQSSFDFGEVFVQGPEALGGDTNDSAVDASDNALSDTASVHEQTFEMVWTGEDAQDMMFTEESGDAVSRGAVAIRVSDAVDVLPLATAVTMQPRVAYKVWVSFRPCAYGETMVALCIRQADKGHAPYCNLSIRGVVLQPYLSFDTPAVRLPIARVHETARVTARMHFNGYAPEQRRGVRTRIPADMADGPLEVVLQEDHTAADGTMAVTFTYTSPTTVAFDTTVEFFDTSGREFPLRVTGGVDGAMLTTYTHALAVQATPTHAATLQALSRWISSFGLTAPRSLAPPASLLEACGKTAFDMAAYLGGWEVPGIKLVRPWQQTTDEALHAYSCLLDHLTRKGGVVSNVDVVTLLPREHFEAWKRDTYARMVADGSAFSRTGHEWLRAYDDVEAEFEAVQTVAWTRVVMQMVRVFVVSKVTQAALERETHDYITHVQRDIPNRSHYGADEVRLLDWLTYHLQQHTGNVDASVTNFDADLQSGTALAAVITAYVPAMATQALRTVYPKPQNEDECRHNACCVILALQSLSICDHAWHWSDITAPHPAVLIPAVTYLFEVLPQFRPQETSILFEGALRERIRRCITLSNPSAAPIAYRVRLEGSTDYTCAERTLRVPAKGQAPLELWCTPTSYESSHATLYLLGRTTGGSRAAVLAYNLDARSHTAASSSQLHVKSACYEKLAFEVPVTNTFAEAATFQVSVAEVSATAARKSARQELSPSKRTLSGRKEALLHKDAFADNHRRALWTSVQEITLAPHETRAIPCHFCPTRLGSYRGAVLLSNAALGQVEAVVTAYGDLPRAESVTWQVNACTSSALTVAVPYANQRKVAAVADIPDALHPDLTRNLTLATDHSGVISDAVAMHVDVHFHGTLNWSPFRAPPQLVLQPAEPDRAGTLMATHLYKSSLVKIKETTELPLTFDAVAAGKYSCDVILTGRDDIRLYTVVVTVADEIPPTPMSQPVETTRPCTFACVAHETASVAVAVVNPTSRAITYEVYGHELPKFVAADASDITVPAQSTGLFDLDLLPTHSGTFTGRLSFVAAAHVQVCPVEINVERASISGSVVLESDGTDSVECTIALSNPTDEPLVFTCRITGDDEQEITANPTATVQPNSELAYVLTYSPSARKPSDSPTAAATAYLSFVADEMGEFYYEIIKKVSAVPLDPAAAKTVAAAVQLMRE
eukprot:m.1639941 g.1639941  ORF g.1639941 m.1639941 type:complete len:2316 (+) comp38926_c0_seq1:162-7109(+)